MKHFIYLRRVSLYHVGGKVEVRQLACCVFKNMIWCWQTKYSYHNRSEIAIENHYQTIKTRQWWQKLDKTVICHLTSNIIHDINWISKQCKLVQWQRHILIFRVPQLYIVQRIFTFITPLAHKLTSKTAYLRIRTKTVVKNIKSVNVLSAIMQTEYLPYSSTPVLTNQETNNPLLGVADIFFGLWNIIAKNCLHG